MNSLRNEDRDAEASDLEPIFLDTLAQLTHQFQLGKKSGSLALVRINILPMKSHFYKSKNGSKF